MYLCISHVIQLNEEVKTNAPTLVNISLKIAFYPNLFNKRFDCEHKKVIIQSLKLFLPAANPKLLSVYIQQILSV